MGVGFGLVMGSEMVHVSVNCTVILTWIRNGVACMGLSKNSLKWYTLNIFLSGGIFVFALLDLKEGNYKFALLGVSILAFGAFVDGYRYKELKEALTYRNEN
jgi:hypothetical protein